MLPSLARSLCKEAMIRNLPLTLKDISESAAKAIATQEKPLDFLSEVVLDNTIPLDYFFLSVQGDVCAMAITTCCTWIDTSGT